MILVLEEGLSLDAIHRVEAMVRRAGGEPRRLVGRGADGGAVDGRDAIEAKGGDARMLRAVPGVALLLDAHCAYPRVARQEGLATAVNVPPGRPLATLGGLISLHLTGQNLNVASGVGFIRVCARTRRRYSRC